MVDVLAQAMNVRLSTHERARDDGERIDPSAWGYSA